MSTSEATVLTHMCHYFVMWLPAGINLFDSKQQKQSLTLPTAHILGVGGLLSAAQLV